MAVSSEGLDDMEERNVDTWEERHRLGDESELRWQSKLKETGIESVVLPHAGHRPDIRTENDAIYQVKNCLAYNHNYPGLLCEENSYNECLRRERAGEDVWMVFETRYGWRIQRPSGLIVVREPRAYEHGSPTLPYIFDYDSTVGWE